MSERHGLARDCLHYACDLSHDMSRALRIISLSAKKKRIDVFSLSVNGMDLQESAIYLLKKKKKKLKAVYKLV